MSSESALLQQLQQILSEHFEIAAERVTPEADIYDDLELDSIDAVDLVIHVQEATGAKISAEDFRSARTVGDVVAIIRKLLAA